MKFSGKAVLLTAIAFIFSGLSAKSATSVNRADDDIKVQINKYWADYAAGFQKINDEKDNQKATALCDQLGKKLAPQYRQLKQRSIAWKKSHSSTEWLNLVTWTQHNPNVIKTMTIRSSPGMLMRMAQDAKFTTAYGMLTNAAPIDAGTTL